MRSAKRNQEIIDYTNQLIRGVMDWYVQGDAVDCDITRRNIQKDLDTVLPRVAAKFHLKPVPGKVLRARSDGRGWFVVRVEDQFLN